MGTYVDISDMELAELKALTNKSDAAEAVRVAMREYIRFARRQRLKELSGRVEMEERWRGLDRMELGGDCCGD